MSRRKNGKSFIHTNTLRHATQDEIALALAVEEKFLDLCGSYLRIKGVKITLPQDMDREFLGWRTMRVRHKKGDFRCTDAEVRCVHAIAQWTLDVNGPLRNQPFAKPLEALKHIRRGP